MDRSEVFDDALFRQKRKKGKYRLVKPPQPALEGAVADTHAHVHLLADPAGSLARCAVHGVGFVCDIVDVWEDDCAVLDAFDGWLDEASSRAQAFAEKTSEAYGEEPSIASAPSSEREEAGSDGASATVQLACENPAVGLSVPSVRFAVGCHPHNAKHYDDALEAALRERLADPRVAAVGEIGLDYHYDFSPREDQREVFRRQIRLAKEFGLPVVLHVREAHDEAFAILEEEGFPQAGTLLHCYNLDAETLAPWLERDCYVAFGGPVTFKQADEVREAAATVPLDRLLTETDAPYMTPEPLRGIACGPEHVVFTAERLAQVRGCAPGEQREALLAQLYANAQTLLNRPRP